MMTSCVQTNDYRQTAIQNYKETLRDESNCCI